MSVILPDLQVALKTGFGVLLAATVVTMALIDCREMILPNRLNLLLAASGIGQAVFVEQPTLLDACLGALSGFLVLSALAASFRYLRGIDGLGFGDQKFSAAVGLWIGWQHVAVMFLIASCSALVFVAIRAAEERKFDAQSRLPFGPFLGLGAMVCWLAAAASGS
jgi:leader peptidase (prepilin peptidase) / N-methyltransferase